MLRLLILLVLLWPQCLSAQTARPAIRKDTTSIHPKKPLKSSATGTAVARKLEKKVYICKGTMAYTYHKSEECDGLEKCYYAVEAVPLSEATGKYKRRPCKLCY